MTDFVYLIEENVFAEVLERGAHYAQVKFSKDGVMYETMVTDEEYEDVE